MIRILSVIAALLFSGCASQLSVTYNSDPPGAVLYQGGQRIGYTPYTLYYDVSKEDKKRGFMDIAGTRVQWASGATAGITSLRADFARYGLSQQFTFNRPDGVLGRETDVRFSLELERTRAMQEQATAQRRQAAAQEERAAAAKRSTNCTSTVIGSIVTTSCY
ncbi:MAG: hypothetical protein LBE81_00710 [Azonexus sp.]|jgi:hypothetical protein|uniref:hypothetical protein n=1 Tax=Azonexus sp. TaxID=1872668 RepID=UPI002824F806|nr:hypothetical protein [Azonexus sp.]MDR0775147.1 hypothetical protein [Azonexus sp.]